MFWGLTLQYIFAILILRTQWGFDMFDWLGDRVTEFLDYVMAGILFAYGDSWDDHLFATKVRNTTHVYVQMYCHECESYEYETHALEQNGRCV